MQTNIFVLFQYSGGIIMKTKLVMTVLPTSVVCDKLALLKHVLYFFKFEGENIEIVGKFMYLGITFTTGGSFKETHRTLSSQALKAIFKLNQYLYNFTDLLHKHVLDLFDTLVRPILCYGAEVWVFSKFHNQERVHLQFCKKLLGVKRVTQNDFVYGELGRVSLQVTIHLSIIKYWLKILECENVK